MAGCSFPLGLLPDLSGILPLPQLNKDVCSLIKSGGAFENPLEEDITSGLASVDAATGTINNELTDIGTDVGQLITWESTPPTGWTSQDMTDVKDALEIKETCANDLNTARSDMRSKMSVDFSGHTNRLSGKDLTTTTKPNLFAMGGLEQAVAVTREQFGESAQEETTNLFGSLYDGGDKLAEIKTETDGTPIGDVSALAIQSTISGGTAAADKANLIASIDQLACQSSGTTDAFASDITALIAGDDAAYTALANEMLGCLGSFQITNWLTDPFKLPFIGCIGSDALKALIPV